MVLLFICWTIYQVSHISPIESTKLNARWYGLLFNQPVRLPPVTFYRWRGSTSWTIMWVLRNISSYLCVLGLGPQIIGKSRMSGKLLFAKLFIGGDQKVRKQLQTGLDNYVHVEEKVLSLLPRLREGWMGQDKMCKESTELSIKGWVRICPGWRKGVPGKGIEADRTVHLGTWR